MYARMQDCHGHDLKLVYDLGRNLFGPPGPKGLDLIALNIQRGRDHGLPTFNHFREKYFGNIGKIPDFTEAFHSRRTTSFLNIFLDATKSFDRDILKALSQAYDGQFDQLDAWVGFLAERRLPGWEWGITLSRLLAEQFKRYRSGDRFFWTNHGVFTLAQRRALSGVSLAGIICANSQITEIQPNVFKLPMAVGNRRKACAELIQDEGAALIDIAKSLQAWRGSPRKSDGTLRSATAGIKRNRRSTLQHDPNGQDSAPIHDETTAADAAFDDLLFEDDGVDVEGQGIVDRLPSTTACPACQSMVGACGIEDVPPLQSKFVQFETGISGGLGLGFNDILSPEESSPTISFTINSFRKLTQTMADEDLRSPNINSIGGDQPQEPLPFDFHTTYRRRIARLAGVNTSDVIIRSVPKPGLLTASFVFGRQPIGNTSMDSLEGNISNYMSNANAMPYYNQNGTTYDSNNNLQTSEDDYTDAAYTGDTIMALNEGTKFPVSVGSVPADFVEEVTFTVAAIFELKSANVKALDLRDLKSGDGVVVDLEIMYAGKDESEFGTLTSQAATLLDQLQTNTTDIFAKHEHAYFDEFLPVDMVDIITEVYRMNTTVVYSNPSSSDEWSTTQTKANDFVEVLALETSSLFDDDDDTNDNNSAIPELGSLSIDGLKYGNGPIPLDPLPLQSSVSSNLLAVPPSSSSANNNHFYLLLIGGLVATVGGIGGACIFIIRSIHAKSGTKANDEKTHNMATGEKCALEGTVSISNKWEILTDKSQCHMNEAPLSTSLTADPTEIIPVIVDSPQKQVRISSAPTSAAAAAAAEQSSPGGQQDNVSIEELLEISSPSADGILISSATLLPAMSISKHPADEMISSSLAHDNADSMNGGVVQPANTTGIAGDLVAAKCDKKLAGDALAMYLDEQTTQLYGNGGRLSSVEQRVTQTKHQAFKQSRGLVLPKFEMIND
ncbi:hypothetical protein CYMTET_23871 [Cymbomonas tetramitiformis]|uniref:Heme peroxidase n=1 Tax=Cymbomonas tetramitiformis TaxID=36881 RepID=A0AAE0FXH8_9CHLO|nr:hypothetical protein CYMTET_23871 [Cymbomonas tetramitiformis]